MFEKLFIKLFGMKFNGDNCVYDRYQWLDNMLSKTNDDLELIDIGCGNGWALFLASKKGYKATGLSHDSDDIAKINTRSRVLGNDISLLEMDVSELKNVKPDNFDVLINMENIEHIKDDKQMISDMSLILKERGLVYFTTTNIFYKLEGDYGPFDLNRTDGGHVRKGYTHKWLKNEFEKNRLKVIYEGWISGPFSLRLLSLNRKIPSILIKPTKLLLIPLTIISNFLDRVFFRNYIHSLSCCFILKRLAIDELPGYLL